MRDTLAGMHPGIKHGSTYPDTIAPPTLSGGRWKAAQDLRQQIAIDNTAASPIGSYTLDVLRYAEGLATLMNSDVDDWSALYAKEVAEPG